MLHWKLHFLSRKKGGIWQHTQTVHILNRKITWVNKTQLRDYLNTFGSENAWAEDGGKSLWEQTGVGAPYVFPVRPCPRCPLLAAAGGRAWARGSSAPAPYGHSHALTSLSRAVSKQDTLHISDHDFICIIYSHWHQLKLLELLSCLTIPNCVTTSLWLWWNWKHDSTRNKLLAVGKSFGVY